VVSLAVEHTWDGRAVRHDRGGKGQAAALARQVAGCGSIQELTKEKTTRKPFRICRLERRPREGKGSVSTESGALEPILISFFKRTVKKQASMEELLTLGQSSSLCHEAFVRLFGMRTFVRRGRQQIGSRHRQGRGAFPYLGPSHVYREDTRHRTAGVPVDRRKSKGRLPCLQNDEGRDGSGHSPLVIMHEEERRGGFEALRA